MTASVLRLAALAVLTLLLAACGSTPRRAEPPLVAGTPRADAANAVLFRAIALVGTPYRYGGNTPDGGFDCSGLVGYVFRDAAGVGLPRTSMQMSEIGKRKLAVDALQAGDLVFFAESRTVSHVGIYVGERRFVHAPNRGGTVRLDSLDGAWWREHFVYGKRALE
ncbi:C40 family peptidase [Dokdonella sp.]|uniref:C40 family peptidase n=1 Tax=Dokdonella sp. TaxID=2291710 RepID=UPI0025BC282D|nr:C40 family peptidase [Dokdonella sp.]